MNETKIKLFGAPDVQINGVHVDFSRRKCLALLAYLAVTGERHSRESLADLLWPETNSTRALANLRNVLYALNQTVEILDMDRKTIALSDHPDIIVDVNVFRRHLRVHEECVDDSEIPCKSCFDQLKQAVEICRDDFMIGYTVRDSVEFEQWQLLETRALNMDKQIALRKCVDYLESTENWDQALNYARRLVNENPYEESMHRRLMTILASSGRTAEALQQYQACCRVLQVELNLDPEDETQDLHNRIRNGKFQHEPQDKVSMGFRLPVQSTPFIGRKKELDHLVKLITKPDHRLVTMAGPGGCGKTRLACQAAAEVAGYYINGVAWVSLASVDSIDFIVSKLAESLNLNIPRIMSSIDLMRMKSQLILHLQEKQMLIVLDNFEHLLDGAGIVSEILDAAPHVKILITSRERLNLHGEWVYEIKGLDFADQSRGDAFEKTDAVRLFIQSAQQSSTAFALTDQDKSDIARICWIVQGSPLAIELSAAWVRVLSCSEIADEITSNLDFLASSLENLTERHRSIRAVFEQSWELLTQEDRECFRKLAVLRGGFNRQAAFEIGKGSYRILASLMDKSILQRAGSDRFEIHEVLRQYAEERLKTDPPKFEHVCRSHSRYYLRLVREKEKTIRGFDQKGAVRTLLLDIENIRIAWLWAADNRDFSSMLDAAPGLFLYYDIRIQFLDGLELFKQAFDRIEPALTVDTASQGKQNETMAVLAGYLLGVQGWFLRFAKYSVNAVNTSDHPIEINRADQLMDRGFKYIQPFDNRAEWAQVLLLATYLKSSEFDEKTVATLRTCLKVFEKHGDSWGAAMCLDGIGCSRRHCDVDHHEIYAKKALEVRKKAGDQWGTAMSYGILGKLEEKKKNLSRAKMYYQQSWAIRNEQGLDINGEIESLANLADAEYQLNQFNDAFQHLKMCLALSETMSNFSRTALIMGFIGERYYKIGELNQATDYLNQCIALSIKHGHAEKHKRFFKMRDEIHEKTPALEKKKIQG